MAGLKMLDVWRGCGLFALAVWLGAAPAPALAQAAVGAAANDGWRICASEGQTCRVDQRTVVRYGADERWSSRVVLGNVECGNEAFGDPAPQAVKQCQVRDFGGGAGAGGSPAEGWAFCAGEGEVCAFRGRAEVRFGTAGRFTTRTAYDRVRCGVEDFGDPAFGITKHCEVRSAAALPVGPNRPTWGGPQPSTSWRYCAAEGQSCLVNGRAQVRFGDGRRYTARSIRGEVDCSVAAFGDPAKGVIKHCEVQSGGWQSGGVAGWSRCAGEGERCAFNGQAQVRYGTGGRYVYREAFNSLDCATTAFGSDPYPGQVKSCEIRR